MFFLLSICLLGAFLCIAFAFTSLIAPKKSSIAERVRAASAGDDSGVGGLRDQEKMKKSFVDRVVIPMAGKYSRHFSGITPAKMLSSAEKHIARAGMQNKVTPLQLLTISWGLLALLPLFLGILFLPHVASESMGLMTYVGILAFAAFLGYRLPIGIVAGKAKKRMKEIQLALPFSFDLVSIAVSAGMSFDGAMSMVSERTTGALSEEFRRTLREVNLGIAREEALNNLAERTGVEDLKTFITAINYITKLGGNITEVIAIQTEALRIKRQQRAEQKANQAPVKIMIPLVLFILPCVFIVILGPAVVGLLVNPP